MKEFIIDILGILGLGVHGNIQSYKSYTALKLFPKYTFVFKDSSIENTTIGVQSDIHIFDIKLTHDDKGYITKIEIE